MAAIGYIIVILGIFLGDLWIKNRIEKSEADGNGNVPKFFWSGHIRIRKYHNRGAMLNLGEKHGFVVASVSVVLSAAMTVVFVCSLGQRGNRLLRLGLSLLLGGAFSNTYDRLKRQYVVDYLTFNVGWKALRRVVFNLSDFCIMIGALLTVLGTPSDML